jgi:O-antigen/teichoic acid export membrane protein
LYGVSIAVMKGISLLMLPFIAHHLPASDFGRLEVLGSLAMIASVLVGLGLEDTLYRYAGQAASRAERHRLAAQIFGLASVVGVLAGVAGWQLAPLLANSMPGEVGTYEVRLVLLVLALEGCIAVPLGWLRMQQRALEFFCVSIGRAALQAALTVLALYLDRGFAGVLEAGLVAAVVQAGWLARAQLLDTGARFCVSVWRELTVYSLPIVASGVVAFSLNGLDRWILAEQAGIEAVAEYGIAAKFALAAVLLLQPFNMWWSPRRFEVLRGVDGAANAARFITIGVTLVCLITLIVGLLSPLMVRWLMPSEYHGASAFAIGLVLAMGLREAAELLNIGCFAGSSTRAQLVINFAAAVLGLTLMLLLAPRYGVWGVVASIGLAQGLRLIAYVQFGQYLLPLPLPLLRLSILALVTAVSLALVDVDADLSAALVQGALAIGCVLTMAFVLGLLLVPKAIKDGRRRLVSLIRERGRNGQQAPTQAGDKLLVRRAP